MRAFTARKFFSFDVDAYQHLALFFANVHAISPMSVVIESQKQLYDDVDAWCQQAGAGAADAGALDWDVTKVYDFRPLHPL